MIPERQDGFLTFKDISNGNLYKSLGFEYVRQTSSYWYVDKSEFDIMEMWNKYYHIHDSGQTKWILKCNKKEEPN